MPVLVNPDARARALLRSLLTPAQRDELRRFGSFTEKSYHFSFTGGKCYVASDYDGGLCIHVTKVRGPQGNLAIPEADQAIALLLFIRADHRGFRRTANNMRSWP